MKKTLCFLAFALAIAACQDSIEQVAARDAREITEKKCPMPLNAEGTLVLENIEFDIPTHTWKQNFLLRMEPGATPIDHEQARQLLLDELKNNPSYQPYMDNGFIFHYVYCNMANPADTLINLKLTASDYR